jgi:hypothetical protein
MLCSEFWPDPKTALPDSVAEVMHENWTRFPIRSVVPLLQLVFRNPREHLKT